MKIRGVEAGQVALAKVCLPAILHARSIEALAVAEGMLPASFAGGKADKAWRLGMAQPAHAVAWGDDSCTAVVDKGSATDLRAMAEHEILARPEGFKLGSTAVVEDGRLERSVYCARTDAGWALVSITVPGPKPVARTRALSSTVYLRPTPSALCGPGQ
ncbi:hypothetical protein [Caulobacter sp.]|uniref:hypothetical protein n=1 Tax=Caulobacter sp. TaxID=78 RepID=UPI001B0F6528|nr:hypothetical protein [Caulobacter sp.]MBO9543839.1 hypothetical protein [Caulobacter sp.]